ncbi:hypothetical protein BDB00DRAFT_543146 [Zychaea mexicana]|uniref:uncharacterized protein n=1 Tax=Zychaea mexicana TaxID=64656 RepID=UPI0022FEE758|nr:uncharacterized protein BDB00DRAFT_543146 [Zychaea mexicana]KAI9497860.1 hypothetical protein BDB00DRAFT_543146 [Zychaea mexicana]
MRKTDRTCPPCIPCSPAFCICVFGLLLPDKAQIESFCSLCNINPLKQVITFPCLPRNDTWRHCNIATNASVVNGNQPISMCITEYVYCSNRTSKLVLGNEKTWGKVENDRELAGGYFFHCSTHPLYNISCADIHVYGRLHPYKTTLHSEPR